MRNTMTREYLVQAILVDRTGRNTIETVANSRYTTDYESVVDEFMLRHKNSNHYLYIALDVETSEVVYKNDKNRYY